MKKPTDVELEILQILWKEGPSTVRFVNDELNKQRANETGYTTTLKMLQLMTEKGLVNRDTSSRTHIYQALLNQEDTQKNLVNRLVDTAFGGSAMKLVMQALGNKKTSKKDLEEIKKMINKLEKGGES
ncbi:MAG TPA: transcriptional regulator [Microscillaceae bacterium]|nr:transcriptional regulator [Microscillaceae bacterium]